MEKIYCSHCKEIGYTSISQDLVFGLPHQTKESIVDTISKTKLLFFCEFYEGGGDLVEVVVKHFVEHFFV